MIQVFSNTLGTEELTALKDVFDSKWLGRGKECAALEKELGEYFSCADVLLTNCCTSAIYIALRALGISKGDEVIIPSVNFLAIPNAVIDLGAKPVFADVDPDYLSITPQEVARLKTPATKAIFLLHYGGHPVPFDEIRAAAGNNVLILEDSANSVASRYKGRHCGTLGDAGVFSFDAMKILVMGDGGALCVRDPEVRAKAKALRYLGYGESTTSGLDSSSKGNGRWWEFQLEATSGRFISNDILACLGRAQLKKLPSFIQRRKEIWDIYQKELPAITEISCPPEPLSDTTSSYYLYWIRAGRNRDELAHFLKEKGIYTTFRYFPLHKVRHYGVSDTCSLKICEEISEDTLNIPVHNSLSDGDVQHIIDSLKEFYLGKNLVFDLKPAIAANA